MRRSSTPAKARHPARPAPGGAGRGAPWPGSRARSLGAVLLALALALNGCAYFNTFYHARQFYSQANKARETEQKTANLGAVAGITSTSGTGRSGDLYKKCVDKCQKLIDDYPGSKWQDDAYLLMAKAYYGRGDYLSAGRTLDRIAELFPESELLAAAAYWKGLTQFAQEDYEGARGTWQDLLAKYPKSEDREAAEYYMARALAEENDPVKAEDAFRTFLEHYPNGDEWVAARLKLGELLLEDKKYDEAQKIFTYVAGKAPREEDRTEAQLNLGETMEAQDQSQDALVLYRDLELHLDPDVLKGRLSAKERETWEKEQETAREAARQDSVLASKFNPTAYDSSGNPIVTSNPNAAATTQNLGYDPTQPFDPNNLNDPRNPSSPYYDPNNPNPIPAAIGATTAAVAGAQGVATLSGSRRTTLPPTDPRYEELGRVMIREGRTLASLDKPWDAIMAYEQVIAEYPRTALAAEAQYRIGYTYEVNLEDFDSAQKAYDKVAQEGRSSFIEDAQNRSKNLATVKSLMASASSDSASTATAAAAEARFLHAELYLFQQDKPEKALEEYIGIQKDFAGTDHAAKAALAEAWVRMNALADTARGRAKYADVMRTYPNTEYGRRATRILKGPEKPPRPEDFAGPSLDVLRDPVNVASVSARDSLLAAAEIPARPAGAATADSAAALSDSTGVGSRQMAMLEAMRARQQATFSQPPTPGNQPAVGVAVGPGPPPDPNQEQPAPYPTPPRPEPARPAAAEPAPGQFAAPGQGTEPGQGAIPGPAAAPGAVPPGSGASSPPLPGDPAEALQVKARLQAEAEAEAEARREAAAKAAPARNPNGNPGPATPAGPVTPPARNPNGNPDPATAAGPPGVEVADELPPTDQPPPMDVSRKPAPVGPSGNPLNPMAVPVPDGWSPGVSAVPGRGGGTAPAPTASDGTMAAKAGITPAALSAKTSGAVSPLDPGAGPRRVAAPADSTGVRTVPAAADSTAHGTAGAPADTTGMPMARADTTGMPMARADTVSVRDAGADSAAAPADTSGRGGH